MGEATAERQYQTIRVRRSEPLDLMRQIELKYVERFGVEPAHRGGWYEPDGWKRISRVFERLDKGGDILDVGSGAGQFVNALAMSGEFRSVTTIDTANFTNYIELSDDIRRINMSAAEMEFPDDSFDVVVCMEVLEHLPEEIFLPAIAELRRVCRGQLVMTVPYREPEPISKTHVRRFEDDDFPAIWPNATFAILDRPRKPWMLIQERFDGRPNKIAIDPSTELDALRSQIAALEAEVARLRSRKSLRAANWAGKQVRQARRLAREKLRR